MNRVTAEDLLYRLQNAYPFSDLATETGRVYLDALEKMDEGQGERAVRSAIEGQMLFPSIAQLLEHYRIVRELDKRLERDEERRAEAAAYDNLPRVPLREIPELLERWEPKLGLELAGEGACEDCEKEGKRYRFERLALCGECAAARSRVRTQVFLFGDG
jgi:hypothetical protein